MAFLGANLIFFSHTLRCHHLFDVNELLLVVKNILSTIENTNEKNPKDAEGNTPLHEAVKIENFSVFQEIIKNCNDIAPQNNRGQTPLHLAAWFGNSETCEFIINEMNY